MKNQQPRLNSANTAIYLVERVWFDLGEFVFHVVWIHGSDLLSRWRPEYLDDLYQLIDARFSRE